MNKRSQAKEASTSSGGAFENTWMQTNKYIFIYTYMTNLHKYIYYSDDNEQIMAYLFK